MCACTEPVRTGLGAVCVEYGRPKWQITMLNQIRVQKNVTAVVFDYFYNFWHPMRVRPAMKRPFCLKEKNRLGRFAPSALPHYYELIVMRQGLNTCSRAICDALVMFAVNV